MLIPAFYVSVTGRDYAQFISILSWYTMYCFGKMGASKDDYVSGFNTLKHYYNDLFHYDAEQPHWAKVSLGALLEKIQKFFDMKNLTDEHIAEIGNLLYGFETNDKSDFERKYFEYCTSKILQECYPNKIYDAVYDLMNHQEYESAILAAFKFLDSHLQTLLNVDANRYYGEDLINHAFSPNSGVLQVQGHSNEQTGVRNFFSGANALLRNPSAHRFVKYSYTTAAAIVAMVDMMAELASRIKENRNSNPKGM